MIGSFAFMEAQTHVGRVPLVLTQYSQKLCGLKISKFHLQHMDGPTGVRNIMIELGN
jgi:hypothetical protein